MRVLTFTTLYPNAVQPGNGIFVENRLRQVLMQGGVEARVVAPVPWFPWSNRLFGRYGVFARVPAAEERHGIPVLHPRYPMLPKLSMTAAPWLLAQGARQSVAELLRTGFDFDVIDAHYFYPDGVAAALLARELGKPLCITARGTDLNLIPRHALPRRMIRWAAAQASGLVTVCQALKDRLGELGVAEDRITVLRNGVDLDQFRPLARDQARQGLGEPGTGLLILSVGQLIERKGHHLIMDALAQLPGARLLIAGDGPDEAKLRAQANRLRIADRVRFLGRVAHERLQALYSAADVLVLASSREGWANVLLEAMACGTPVCATAIWGTPEVVNAPAAGRLITERTATGIATTVTALLADPPTRAATRSHAEQFSWAEIGRAQVELFHRLAPAPDKPAIERGSGRMRIP